MTFSLFRRSQRHRGCERCERLVDRESCFVAALHKRLIRLRHLSLRTFAGSVPRSLRALLLAVTGKVIVYLIRNRVNGKVYVGKTERRQAPDKSLAWRWRTHCRVAERGGSAMLHRAIRKYGAASFSAEVICETADRFELIEFEKKFIAQFRSFPPALGFGYNLTAGGEGLIGFKPTAEQRQRLVTSHLGETGDRRDVPPLYCARSRQQRGAFRLSLHSPRSRILAASTSAHPP